LNVTEVAGKAGFDTVIDQSLSTGPINHWHQVTGQVLKDVPDFQAVSKVKYAIFF